MSLPKLEACVSILQILKSKGQLRADEIASSTQMDRALLTECLSLLAEEGMLEKKRESAAVYAVTEHGRKVLTFFKIPCS